MSNNMGNNSESRISGGEMLRSRQAGVIMPVFSLPSAHGIGTLGKAAFEFIDFLAAAGQKLWQVLPLNPTGFGDSPYASCSVFAGNPYFIDFDALIEVGLLKKSEVNAVDFGKDKNRIDYEKLYLGRGNLLKKAFKRANKEDDGFIEFTVKNAEWLDDYALFMALKTHFSMKPWQAWEDAGARLHRPSVLKKYGSKLQTEIEFHKYLQYLFYSQWEKVKTYANSRGIGIIGDMPIYCALDSVDCWANINKFQLDKDGRPKLVAGVPPDAFNEDGQLWGNPLYDWKRMKRDGYAWWMRRLEQAADMFDIIRIDHFRALEGYWAVPAEAGGAEYGHWENGPGLDFVLAIKKRFPGCGFIAEDLGYLTEDVHELRRASGFLGMKVLEFAFDPSGKSDYLPHKYDKDCVCYTGTHDNDPLGVHLGNISKEERAFIRSYLGTTASDTGALTATVLRAGLASTASVFVSQMQDWLKADASSRINTPGTSENNWQWRVNKSALSGRLASKMRALTELYDR